LVKDSSLVSVIAVYELTYQAGDFVSLTFRPFEIYTGLAVVYFLLTYPLVLVTGALERRIRVT
jgi:polar amino acid transport system permease protein